MFTRRLLYTLSLSACLATGPSTVYAMRRSGGDEDMPFVRGLITRVATAQGALLLGARLEAAKLPGEIKAPLFTGLFVIGAYGLDWYDRPTITGFRSTLLGVASTGVALAGMGYILKQANLSSELKASVYSALVGISLWRLCKDTSRGE